MFERAKWCPECGELNGIADASCRNKKCTYSFVGGELGSESEPVTMQTEVRGLPDASVPGRMAAISREASDTATSRKEEVRILLIEVGQSLIAAAVGALFYALAASRARASGGKQGLIMLLVSFVAGIVFVIMLLGSLWRFVRKPKFGSPKQVMDCFYGELLGAGRARMTRPWSCLDASAKAEYGSIEEFKSYWKRRESEFKEWALQETQHLLARRPQGHRERPNCAVRSGSVQIQNRSDTVADVRSEILVTVFELVEARKDMAGNSIMVTIRYKDFVWPQSKTVLMGSGRWYLTSGTLDGPTMEGKQK